MQERKVAATFDDRRADWLYEKFQAISKAQNNYLYLLLFFSAFSFITFDGAAVNPHVSLFGITVHRTLVLSGSALIGAWLIVAYCGNYDMGEATLMQLAKCVSCNYEDLSLVDTHPNLFDFSQYARPARAEHRGVLSRCSVRLLYPAALFLAWCWFVFLTLAELIDPGGLWAAKILCLIALITLLVAFRRLSDFVGRRWRTFIATEEARKGRAVGL
jgi:hypothetical protein